MVGEDFPTSCNYIKNRIELAQLNTSASTRGSVSHIPAR